MVHMVTGKDKKKKLKKPKQNQACCKVCVVFFEFSLAYPLTAKGDAEPKKKGDSAQLVFFAFDPEVGVRRESQAKRRRRRTLSLPPPGCTSSPQNGTASCRLYPRLAKSPSQRLALLQCPYDRSVHRVSLLWGVVGLSSLSTPMSGMTA